MAQQQSPWLEGSYGWSFGEGGWNTGMDQNLLKFSFMFDRNVDSIVSSLPTAVDGQAHYLTTDNRIYFAVGTTYFSTPVPKWFIIFVRSTGQTHQFNGTTLVQIDTPEQLDSRIDSVELTVSNLGTAAFQDVEFFASQVDLDVESANAAAYTDTLRDEISDSSLTTKGAGLVGYKGRTVFDRNQDFVSVFDYLTPAEIADVRAKTYNLDVTAKIQTAVDENPYIMFPFGGYLVSQLTIPGSAVAWVGAGKNGTTFRHKAGSAGSLLVWDGATRILNANFAGIYLEGHGGVGETSGWDISGISYSSFLDIRCRLFAQDGIYANGAITPTNKQVSNNTFRNCTFNNNLRDGIRLEGTDPQRFENTAMTFVGCEFAGNAGKGVNGDVCESTQFLGCTAQGNTGRDVYFNSRFSVFTGYVEGNAKGVEMGPLAYGCEVKIRSGYPLWNTFINNSATESHELSVMGEAPAEVNLFANPQFIDWPGTVPSGLTLNGSPTVASIADTRSVFASDLRLTINANFQGLIFTLLGTNTDLQDKWVTLVVEVNTSGVTDNMNTRVYTRDNSTLNSATGEFAVELLPHTASGTYRKLFYDVKFDTTVTGTPTLIWYIGYDSVGAGPNVIDIRSAHILVGQTRRVAMFAGDQSKPIVATTTQLASLTSGINIHRKFEGKLVWNTTTDRPVWAVGAAASDVWRFADGTTAHTPV